MLFLDETGFGWHPWIFIQADSLNRMYFLTTVLKNTSPFLRIRTVFTGKHLMIWIAQVVDDQTKSTLTCTLLSVSSRHPYEYTSRAALSSQWVWNSDEFNCSVVYRQHDDSIAHLVLARSFMKRLRGRMGEPAGHSLPSIKKTRSESCVLSFTMLSISNLAVSVPPVHRWPAWLGAVGFAFSWPLFPVFFAN